MLTVGCDIALFGRMFNVVVPGKMDVGPTAVKLDGFIDSIEENFLLRELSCALSFSLTDIAFSSCTKARSDGSTIC